MYTVVSIVGCLWYMGHACLKVSFVYLSLGLGCRGTRLPWHREIWSYRNICTQRLYNIKWWLVTMEKERVMPQSALSHRFSWLLHCILPQARCLPVYMCSFSYLHVLFSLPFILLSPLLWYYATPLLTLT